MAQTKTKKHNFSHGLFLRPEAAAVAAAIIKNKRKRGMYNHSTQDADFNSAPGKMPVFAGEKYLAF